MDMLKISVGPILTYWPRETVFEFYQMIAESAADIVYLGETVCSRRHELRVSDWLDVADLLAEHGKEVLLSTQTLIESNSELATQRKITENGRYMVEANDMGAVRRLAGDGAFVAGPFLNLYNGASLAMMAGLGARRWVMPVEIGRDRLAQLRAEIPAQLETEVFAYGRMPLAFSARCFTARNRNLPKDDCQFSCLQHPDGLLLSTREGEPFLVLNGTQTQSAAVQNLVAELGEMRELGVDVIRISPQSTDTGEVIAIFDRARRGEMDTQLASEQLAALMPGRPCSGFWYGDPGQE
jgi:O2-independent ubiquinone biosynthesis protein UbiV